ncbi:hypothetical protein B0H66DRAFT_625731 [Apodospora peruviana]|uniref:Uncharacterized protein n=1 Tax=Apodospora peruviana TaxID=516989 RepID=A0AAE0I115_9PEZI|nr:hypothetical protein B0H66DRAFT_625731 [Apodospora peruviana]
MESFAAYYLCNPDRWLRSEIKSNNTCSHNSSGSGHRARGQNPSPSRDIFGISERRGNNSGAHHDASSITRPGVRYENPLPSRRPDHGCGRWNNLDAWVSHASNNHRLFSSTRMSDGLSSSRPHNVQTRGRTRTSESPAPSRDSYYVLFPSSRDVDIRPRTRPDTHWGPPRSQTSRRVSSPYNSERGPDMASRMTSPFSEGSTDYYFVGTSGGYVHQADMDGLSSFDSVNTVSSVSPSSSRRRSVSPLSVDSGESDWLYMRRYERPNRSNRDGWEYDSSMGAYYSSSRSGR